MGYSNRIAAQQNRQGEKQEPIFINKHKLSDIPSRMYSVLRELLLQALRKSSTSWQSLAETLTASFDLNMPQSEIICGKKATYISTNLSSSNALIDLLCVIELSMLACKIKMIFVLIIIFVIKIMVFRESPRQ